MLEVSNRWSKDRIILEPMVEIPAREVWLYENKAALEKVSGIILDGHLHSCLITAVRGENADERERVLNEIADVFEMKKIA